MALFGSARDASLVRSVNRELINNFIDTEVALYKLSLEDTRANMYDESDSKVYYSPLRINCIIEKSEKSYQADDAGYDSTREGFFNFLRDDLKDNNIIIEEGDVIEFGLSVAVRVTAHVTRRNRLNIQEVRSGINKGSIIPRNL